jgi:hypothetical protein
MELLVLGVWSEEMPGLAHGGRSWVSRLASRCSCEPNIAEVEIWETCGLNTYRWNVALQCPRVMDCDAESCLSESKRTSKEEYRAYGKNKTPTTNKQSHFTIPKQFRSRHETVNPQLTSTSKKK